MRSLIHLVLFCFFIYALVSALWALVVILAAIAFWSLVSVGQKSSDELYDGYMEIKHEMEKERNYELVMPREVREEMVRRGYTGVKINDLNPMYCWFFNF
jgi:hypothetical protein